MNVEERLKILRPSKRILSIQSHVVSGYAGNKCSVFPLQLHGFEVDFINSVQFSNHTGYKNGIRGYRFTEKDLKTLYEGLKINNLTNYSHVLSGYCGDASFLRQISEIIKDLKLQNPNLIYVCDPVLGDNGKYYVPEELTNIYRNEILPLSEIITPNSFELSQLSGLPVTTEIECLKAVEKLHEIRSIQTIIVTSGIFANTETREILYCYVSQKTPSRKQYRFEIPVIRGQFVGTGDVFTSLLVVWLNNQNGNVCEAVSNVISSMQSLIKRTSQQCYESNDNPDASARELCLIQSRFDLLVPNEEVKFVELV